MRPNLMDEAYAFVGTFNEEARAAGMRPLEVFEGLILHCIVFLAVQANDEETLTTTAAHILQTIALPTSPGNLWRLRRALRALQAAGALIIDAEHPGDLDTTLTVTLTLGSA